MNIIKDWDGGSNDNDKDKDKDNNNGDNINVVGRIDDDNLSDSGSDFEIVD